MESKFPGDIMHIFTLNPQRLQRAAIKEEYCLQKKTTTTITKSGLMD